MTPAERAALIRAEQSVRMQIRDRVSSFATNYWQRMGSWRDADVDRFVSAVVSRVQVGQLQTAALTDRYLAQLLGDTPSGAIEMLNLRAGVTAEEVYRRPAVEMRTRLSQGASFPDALAASTARLRSLVSMDMQLASTHQARRAMRGSQSGYYRRTLTGAEDCALCVIASTQRYSRGDLLPIHPGCDCGVEPLAPGLSTQQVIDEDLLERTHAEIAAHTGRDSDRGARDLGVGDDFSDYTELIVTREHGEYGPTLAWRSDKFTSAADI